MIFTGREFQKILEGQELSDTWKQIFCPTHVVSLKLMVQYITRMLDPSLTIVIITNKIIYPTQMCLLTIFRHLFFLKTENLRYDMTLLRLNFKIQYTQMRSPEVLHSISQALLWYK